MTSAKPEIKTRHKKVNGLFQLQASCLKDDHWHPTEGRSVVINLHCNQICLFPFQGLASCPKDDHWCPTEAPSSAATEAHEMFEYSNEQICLFLLVSVSLCLSEHLGNIVILAWNQ